MASLLEKISNLANPAPVYFDPEDDLNIETEQGAFTNKNNLQSKPAVLIDDCDEAYAGKKVARKSLDKVFHDDSRGNINFDEELTSEDEQSEADDDDDDIENFKKSLGQQIISDEEIEHDEESMRSAASEEDDDDVNVEEEEDENDEPTEDMVNQFSHIDVNREMEKGAAVKEQLEIINRLCEARIRLQKLIVASRILPQKDCWNAIKDNGGEEIVNCMNKASNASEAILKQCLKFQLTCFEKVNDKQENQETSTLSNEEIPSDTDEEIEKNTSPEKQNKSKKERKKSKKATKILKRKLNSSEYEDLLAKHMKDLTPYRNSILQTWDDKTKLSSGRISQKSFSAFENSVIKQIEQVLQDKDRLIKRTQLKRSMYQVIGKQDVSAQREDAESTEPASKQDMGLKEYDAEIFDDDDFYRQFLRDVIESKSVGIDPLSLRKQMEIQNVRSKIRKKVDTKASKGRKIRYDVDPKVVGFAIAEHTPADDARDSILKSLCGGGFAIAV